MNFFDKLSLLIVLASTFEKLERYEARDRVLAEVRDYCDLFLKSKDC